MAKTDAERMREYRNRKRNAERNVTEESVTTWSLWMGTRHLTYAGFVEWCKFHKPSWLTPAKPGDADYNWEESAVPLHLRPA